MLETGMKVKVTCFTVIQQKLLVLTLILLLYNHNLQ